MKVVHVPLAPSKSATLAGRQALVPELLASVGAKHSRSDAGFDGIMASIGSDQEEAIDRIFNHVDYGHTSIADMVPVAINMDGLSIHLVQKIWSICQTGSGQETSTRYCKFTMDGLVDPDLAGIPSHRRAQWGALMGQCFQSYDALYGFWLRLGEQYPGLMRVPQSLIDEANSGDQKAAKKLDRLRRNYAFDRARTVLPVAAKTNIMLIQSAGAWVRLIQRLYGMPWVEAYVLATALREELHLVAPRMSRHARTVESFAYGAQDEFDYLCSCSAYCHLPSKNVNPYGTAESKVEVSLGVTVIPERIDRALRYHDNRYAHVGSYLEQIPVQVRWSAVDYASIRDLGRHRPGKRHMNPIPVGYYAAQDEFPEFAADHTIFQTHHEAGLEASWQVLNALQRRDKSYPYWGVLGTEYPYEVLSTLDHLIYIIELRTGAGAQYHYADLVRQAAGELYKKIPALKGRVQEGLAEPE